MIATAKKQLRIPIRKPELYKPLVLILTITCLQHFSGFTFTKKFLLQILAPLKKPEGQGDGEDYTGYYFAILINAIRTTANLLMSDFLKRSTLFKITFKERYFCQLDNINCRFRVRFLFCLSLFSTALCLALFGCFLPPSPLHKETDDQLVRTIILAVHVFAVQFGLQSLAGQLTDTLLPSHSKPLLKGFIRSVQSFSLIVFVSLITLIPNDYSAWQFWTMGGTLVLSSPFLYFGIPELRHLGRAAWEFYFLPTQTIFYFVIPDEEERKAFKALRKWVVVISAVRAFKQTSFEDSPDPKDLSEIPGHKRWSYQRQKTLERVGNENQIASFHLNTLDEMMEGEELKKKNKLSVTFVENILGMCNWLTKNPNPERFLLARGPATCVSVQTVQEHTSVGVFLFSDVLIVARKLMKNRNYKVHVALKIDSNFRASQSDLEVRLKNDDKEVGLRFSELGNARMWHQYASFAKSKSILTQTDSA